MKKKIFIIIGMPIFLGVITAIVIINLDWGTVESEIEKSELVEIDDLQYRERSTYVDLNGMDVGNYSASTLNKDNLELLFNIEGLKKTTGRFNEVFVELNIPENRDLSNLIVKIKTASIFTNNSTRDEALVSDEYFDSSKFPSIEYRSNNIERGDSSLIAHGILNFMGQKNELTVPITILGEGMNQNKIGFTAFEGEFDFDRTKYGMLEEKGIGNIVQITFYCEVVHKKD